MHRSSPLVLLAAGLAVLALGLPWGGDNYGYAPGMYLPGACYTGADGYYQCDPGTMTMGYTTYEGAQAGFESLARVPLVAAVALLLLHRSPRRLVLAATLLGAAVALTGMLPRSGAIAALLAAGVLMLARRRSHLAGRDDPRLA